MSDDDDDGGTRLQEAAVGRDVPDFDDFPGDGDAERIRLSNLVAGTIEDVGDDALTIDTGSGDAVDVAVDDDTTVTDTAEVEVGDLAVGDAVRIVGEPSDDDTLEARQITASDDEELLSHTDVPGFGAPPDGDERPDIEDMPDEIEPRVADIGPIRAGTIESIDDDTITVTTEDGETVTVTTSSSTTVQRVSEISLDDLEAGDEVTVFAEDDDGTLTATTVRRGEGIFVDGLPPHWGSDDADDDPDA